MPEFDASAVAVVDRVARQERRALIAALTRRLGADRIDLIDDVAQEALLSALTLWPYQGVPEHPGAWLRRVAWNKALDILRRQARQTDLSDDVLESLALSDFRRQDAPFDDARLEVLALCTNQSLKPLDQILLALRLVGGLTNAESAEALLMQRDAVGQRLARATRRLARDDTLVVSLPSRAVLAQQTEQWCSVIYLMFSVGYLPRHGQTALRQDLCLEALDLARALTAETSVPAGTPHALAALLSFQCARLDARLAAGDRPTLLGDQDRMRWDPQRRQDGFRYLKQARAASREPSRIHLEAAIAGCYAAAPSYEQTDWPAIVRLHEVLGRVWPNPVTKVGHAVALVEAGRAPEALALLEPLRGDRQLAVYAPFAMALAHAYRAVGQEDDARAMLTEAEAMAVSESTRQHIDALLA
ncbi:MAG: sigma-70 family RNA polymerase sigma factor [Pseudomonadota bacterium]